MAGKNALPVFDEESTYADILSELESGETRPGLWAKAFAEADGDDAKGKALYIKLRAAQERDDFEREFSHAQLEQKTVRLEEEELNQRKQQNEQISTALSEFRARGYRVKKNDYGWWVVTNAKGVPMELQSDESFLKYAWKVIGLTEATPSPEENHAEPSFFERPEPANSNDERFSSPLPPVPLQSPPAGVGGWLLLLVVMMLLLSILGVAVGFGNLIEVEQKYPNLANIEQWREYKFAVEFLTVALSVLSLYGGLSLVINRKPFVVTQTIAILWITGPIGVLAKTLVGLALLGSVITGNLLGVFLISSMAFTFFSAIWSTIWTAYLIKSQRVKNTYTQKSQPKSINFSGSSTGESTKKSNFLFMLILGGIGVGLIVANFPITTSTTPKQAAPSNQNARDQYDMGSKYYIGQGVPHDFVQAIRWYKMAADQGYAPAQMVLGFMIEHGQGVPQDYTQAARWYKMAADQGDAEAQTDLGLKYLNGLGVPQDYAKAARWFRMAATQGFAYAQINLGTLYARGIGVPQSSETAIIWLEKAAQQGGDMGRVAEMRISQIERESSAPANPQAHFTNSRPQRTYTNADLPRPHPSCQYKAVMTGDDLRACGITPHD